MRLAPPDRPFAPTLVVLCLVGLLAGCRPGTALHARFNNFRAYYNTYYNAERALEEGESALERQAVTVDRARLVAVFPVTAAAQSGGPFQEAIDKSAELLRNRPTSAWADDALLLIGKAYFYQRNLVGAEQKFREAMAAAALVDDRRLGDEARFWLGRTYAAGDRFDQGVAVLEEGLLDDEGDRRWTARMRLALGELYARASRWDEAAEALRLGAPEEADADVAARAFVLLGQVEEHAERWDAAAEAYAEALERKPAYELGYAAQLGRALVLGLEAGRQDEALEAVRRMRGDDKNYERRGELALVEARLRAAAGDDARALRLYRDVLYDETLSGGIVRGEAHYRLGEFYRDARGDYVRAAAHFDTAATALRAPLGDVRPARGALLDVSDEAQTYASLAGAARRLAEADSLLVLGALPEEAFRARIAAIEAERRRVFREEQRRLDAARTSEAFRGGGATVLRDDPNATATQPAAGTGSREGGFLSFRLPSSLQAGLVAFEQTWGSRPLVPNWRRSAAIQAGDVAAARGITGPDLDGGFGLGEGPPPLDLQAVPRTPEKRSELITDLASLRYELANAFFLSLGRADTAAALYRAILAETPDLPVATRARYALAEIERSAGREAAARPLYEAVAAADSAALGRASRVRLGLEDEAPAASPPPSTAAFDAARERWRRGRPLEAAADLVALADADPDAEVAPRAYLAAAAAYADAVAADSVALVAPLPARLVSPVLLPIADSLAAADADRPAPAASPVAAPDSPPPAAAPDGLDPAGAAPAGDPEAFGAAPVEAAPDLAEDAPGPAARPGARSPAPVPGQVGAVPDAPDAPALPVTPPVDAQQVKPGSVAGLVGDGSARARAVGASPAPVGPLAPLARADSASFTLRHHLRAVAARYTGTPAAARALALAAALPDPPPPAAPDSTLADSTLADSTGDLPDSLRTRPVGPDSLGGPVLAGDAPPPDAAVDVPEAFADPSQVPGLRGEEAVDPAQGGFTWRVQTLTLAGKGEQTARILREAGFRVGILQDRSAGAFIIAIGQFETRERAEAAGPGLPAWARTSGEVVDLTAYQ